MKKRVKKILGIIIPVSITLFLVIAFPVRALADLGIKTLFNFALGYAE